MEDNDADPIIVVRDDEFRILTVSPEIRVVDHVEELIDHVYKDRKNHDSLNIYADGQHFERLNQTGIFDLANVKRITFSFNSLDELERARRMYSNISSKIEFCLKNEVANRIQNVVNRNLIRAGSYFDQETVRPITEQQRLRTLRKLNRQKISRLSLCGMNNVGLDAENIDSIPMEFICKWCGFILRDPFQCECGHRICRSCVENLNGNVVFCASCNVVTSKDELPLDRGFRRDMSNLIIICSLCQWNGLLCDYESHLQLSHANRMSCPLESYGCSNTIHSNLQDHYMSEEHQRVLLHAISHHSGANDLEIDPRQYEELYEMIDILTRGVGALTEDVRRLNTESIQQQTAMVPLEKILAASEHERKDNDNQLNEFFREQESIIEKLKSLQEFNESTRPISIDGTLSWRITNIPEKICEFERGSFIDSPPFYSSSCGYKMCVRLYLNGDSNADYTHMSLSLIIMRGKFDAILSWPFNHQVAFCLFDQTDAQSHIIHSVRPDVQSTSFQQARSEMNIASGIPQFCDLSCLRMSNSPYVKNDSIFIRVMVHETSISDDLILYGFRLNPGLPAALIRKLIQLEKEKSHQQLTNDG